MKCYLLIKHNFSAWLLMSLDLTAWRCQSNEILLVAKVALFYCLLKFRNDSSLTLTKRPGDVMSSWLLQQTSSPFLSIIKTLVVNFALWMLDEAVPSLISDRTNLGNKLFNIASDLCFLGLLLVLHCNKICNIRTQSQH